MAFSWKKCIKRQLLQCKIRYRIYQKSGKVNEQVGRELKLRIEHMEKKIHG